MRPVKNGGRVQNFVYDKNGRLISETDTADNSAISYTYDAFGNENSDNTDDSNSFGYNGEYLDRETGLIYLRARYYDPSIGRFISEDPIKDGSNWYVFCNNNPVTFIDPSGMVKARSDQTMSYWGTKLTPIAYSKVIEYDGKMTALISNYINKGLRFDENFNAQVKSINNKIDDIINSDYNATVLDLIYLNQGDTNECYAYASVMASLYMEGIRNGDVTQEYINSRIKEITNKSPFMQGGYIQGMKNADSKNMDELFEFYVKNGIPPMLGYDQLQGGMGHVVVGRGVMNIDGTKYYTVYDSGDADLIDVWLTREQLYNKEYGDMMFLLKCVYKKFID